MRKIKILEHISLDGVIQHSADDGDFPYSDWTAPYGTPAGRDAILAAYGGSFDLLLGRRTYDIWSGSGQRRRPVLWRTASMRQKNMSLPTVRRVLNGPRSRALGRTSSRAFAASRRRTARTLSFGVAPR
jgi:dihydrofolate reductase